MPRSHEISVGMQDSERSAAASAHTRGKLLHDYIFQVRSVIYFWGTGFLFSIYIACKSLLKGGSRKGGEERSMVIGYFIKFRDWAFRTKQLELCGDDLNALRSLKGSIVIANHPCLLDAVILAIYLPEACCITNSKLFRNPFFGGAVRAAGFIRNDTGIGLVKASLDHLKAGDNMLIFPEGTRTDPGQILNSFKKGFALTAVRSHAPVHCVFIDVNSNYLAKGYSIFSKCPLPLRMHFTFGPVLSAEEGESANAFAERVENIYRDYFGGAKDSRRQTGSDKIS
ncbi:MAG: lysophospholipid acyltransferase family protein [Chthoniobacterales bacterium]